MGFLLYYFLACPITDDRVLPCSLPHSTKSYRRPAPPIPAISVYPRVLSVAQKSNSASEHTPKPDETRFTPSPGPPPNKASNYTILSYSSNTQDGE